jgi:hypothetical protein
VGDSTPQWVQNLFAGWPMIKANLPLFAVILVLLSVAIWWVVNWRYDGIVANKDSEITLLKGQRDDYKDKLNGATPDQAKAKMEALESRVATLEPRLAAIEPRRLTVDQRAALIARLKPPLGTSPTVSVAAEATGDNPQFAADFASVFRSAGGWTIVEPMVMGIGGRPPSGIAVTIPDINHPSPEIATIVRAFQTAKIEFDIRQGPMMQGNAAEILICTRVTR